MVLHTNQALAMHRKLPPLAAVFAREIAHQPGRTFALLIAVLLVLASPACSLAQGKDDPLDENEVDQVRDVADQPIERVKLYMKFIQHRTDAIQEMVGDTKIQNKANKLHNLMEEYTRLVDELQDNLDSYDETHSDVRKALKELVPASEKWLLALNKPPADQNYDFSRKTALEAGQSLVEQARKLQTDQEKWFAEHKKEKNADTGTPPDWAKPKP